MNKAILMRRPTRIQLIMSYTTDIIIKAIELTDSRRNVPAEEIY